MRIIYQIFVSFLFVLLISGQMLADSGTGMPVKYISSCEIDLNGDDKSDIAMLIETVEGRELIVLLRTENGYDSYLVAKGIAESMFLSCHFGDSIKETAAGEDKEAQQDYKVPGAYLSLFQPEGSATAYFWDGTGFKQVWISD